MKMERILNCFLCQELNNEVFPILEAGATGSDPTMAEKDSAARTGSEQLLPDSRGAIVIKHFWFVMDEIVHECICTDCWRKIEEFHRFYLQIQDVHERRVEFPLVDVGNDGQDPKELIEEKIDVDELPIAVFDEATEVKIEPETDSSITNLVDSDHFRCEQCGKSCFDSEDLKRHKCHILKYQVKRKHPEKLERENEEEPSPEEQKNEQKDALIAEHCKMICNNCSEQFRSFAELQIHSESVHRSQVSIFCCNTRYTVRSTLHRHVMKVHNRLKFPCDLCDRVCISKKGLAHHKTKMHANGENKYDKEESLDSSDEDSSQLDAPVNVEESEEEEDLQELTSTKVFKMRSPAKVARDNALIAKYCIIQCEQCSAHFPTFAVLNNHCKDAHGSRAYVYCCEKKFGSRNRLLEHVQLHVNPNQFKCDICDRVCPEKELLKRHKIKMHTPDEEKPFECDRCHKKLAEKQEYKKHMDYHVALETKKYQCKQCEKFFGNVTLLNLHVKNSHPTSYEFVCDTCAKGFNRRGDFLKHLRVHDPQAAEERVQCPECDKWFRKGSLRFHKQLHQPVAINCDICGKESSNQLAHRNHMRYAHTAAKFECQYCEKIFKLSIRLKEHIASQHSGEMLYTCPHCPKTFKSNANMHSHRKKMHYQEWLATRQKRNETFTRSQADKPVA
ncbi:zinc finger protein 91-like [Uranotaenia lowii]|uniref:zinc finger protein 91-like n=1 Tax=Uranotaenia lowii TaxID=190385 RepID=UPI0024785FF6|nr:zinc finger protein 91-like [Uranotaenia lowii]